MAAYTRVLCQTRGDSVLVNSVRCLGRDTRCNAKVGCVRIETDTNRLFMNQNSQHSKYHFPFEEVDYQDSHNEKMRPVNFRDLWMYVVEFGAARPR